mmetsp:Transcript_8528/g.14152  ORF Transcript_8528/g.14152 Transcript_8528/m.14152 type:complete len:247 (-) Transcript_8528:161-901(-)
MMLVIASRTIFLVIALLHTASGYSAAPVGSTSSTDRRAFVSTAAVSTAAALWCATPQQAQAIVIKVTPIAHTFTTSNGATVKPLRENDATRFLTNAKVVFMLEGSDGAANEDLASVVLEMTTKRKADQGAGVTPGKIHVACMSKELLKSAETLGLQSEAVKEVSPSSISGLATKIPPGDTLIVGPMRSGGTGADGKLIAETAQALGVAVGGAREGGVLSILLDGPRADVVLEENGYPISTILWYNV